MVGMIYSLPPQPPVTENTHLHPAGALTIGVEYRNVDPAALEETYADNEALLTELREASPDGGFTDEGVSIHVCGTDDGYEYLRFDLFDDKPHYHYIRREAEGSEVSNRVVEFDTVAGGSMLPWALERIRTRLAPMLIEAGGGYLVPLLDEALIASALDDVYQEADAVQRARARQGRSAG
ncbi:hypothetical protein Ga0074812_10774 [Parafrankia irregularis]|uniref:DUF7700 domain-containing protein n=2 Tax=Parafrankia irregularis TaxID=795642 RepID=A0A0S4QM82_9ACTN|nr:MULTISPECIES: hypothetical protein [Parafrankia]MBE3201354.1 hypothetical protein [Parafrankia sp. CH37]CUU56190.1 hypothetical protein Ga0074812_10774 [Parafrankia irregularis]